jgi:hypothetical protein
LPTTQHPSWPKPVSSWYRFDWQYVLSTGRLPAFKPVAVVLTAMPILTEFASVVPIKTEHFWLIWGASVASLAAFAATSIRCPQLIREYEKYDDFSKVGHSHRWIGWIFYNNLSLYQDIRKLYFELIDKQLAYPADLQVDQTQYAACPLNITSTSGPSATMPVNANRDLYIGISLDNQRFVIPIQEDDPKLESKQKELFWIIYSNLTSSRKWSRSFIWCLYALSAMLFVSAVLLSVSEPLYQMLFENHGTFHRIIDRLGGLLCR